MSNPETFTKEQLQVLDMCVSHGYSIDDIADKNLDVFKMLLAFHAKRDDIDLVPYLKDFDHDQLEEIRLGLKHGLNVSAYAKPNISADKMHMIRLDLEKL